MVGAQVVHVSEQLETLLQGSGVAITLQQRAHLPQLIGRARLQGAVRACLLGGGSKLNLKAFVESRCLVASIFVGDCLD